MSAAAPAFFVRPKNFAGAIGLSGALILLLGLTLILLFHEGIGLWNNNIPVTWALDIVSYDFWIGVACGALLVACGLALLGPDDAAALQRLAATLAVLAAVAAAVYPIIHLGRPWFFFWNLPYPNSFGLWPQVRSPLFWDAIDILAFLGIAVSFWYVGLLPVLARLRDQAFAKVETHDGKGTLKAQLYGITALGWRGADAHWRRWLQAQRVLAVLGLCVVVVLQTGAAIMFSGTLEPGWHDTLMPVDFVCEAGLAGVAILALLAGAISLWWDSQAFARPQLEGLAWGMLLFGAGAGYCFAVSQATAAWGGDPAGAAALARRMGGPQSWSFWLLICGALLPVHLFWLPAFRRSPRILATLGACIAGGIWGGHYMVIVATLQHDFLPGSARAYHIGTWEWATFAGTIGLFTLLLLVFLRVAPIGTGMAPQNGAVRGRAQTDAPAKNAPLWGVSAEFANAEDARGAWVRLQDCHIARLDALSPVPLHLQCGWSPVMVAACAGGGAGTAAMFAFCLYATNYAYVFNIGGRPIFSWPDYVVPSLSCGLLCSGLATTAAMLALNRLPRLNHPAFNIPGIGRASSDRFFVVLTHPPDNAVAEAAERAMRDLPLTPLAIHRVPR